jgi:hypothetical protein
MDCLVHLNDPDLALNNPEDVKLGGYNNAKNAISE